MYFFFSYRVQEWTLEGAITLVLGDIPNIKEIVKYLSTDVGVESYRDLSFVTSDDVKGYLKPVQARRLIEMWQKSGIPFF